MKRFLTLLIVLLALPLGAELTVTVYPGYTFSALERPTTVKLNLLGLPTIEITGTVGGTNAVALAAGSVTGTHLADSVVDDITIDYNGGAPRQLEIKNSGVSTNQISTTIAGSGLAGGGGLPLSVTVDTRTILITNDVLTIGTNGLHTLSVTNSALVGGGADNQGTNISVGTGLAIMGGALQVTNLPPDSLRGFSTIEYTLGTGRIVDTNHSLAFVPQFTQFVLVCKTNDLGYVAGDEVNVEAAIGGSGPLFVSGRNSTNIWLYQQDALTLRNIGGAGGYQAATEPRWRVKGYAR